MQSKYTFTYVCIFASYSKILTGVNFVHVNGALGPIHMHKIYTCKYFASWSKHTHVSKNIFNLRSHANSVHISILKGTPTCCTADMYILLMTAAILIVHCSCT